MEITLYHNVFGDNHKAVLRVDMPDGTTAGRLLVCERLYLDTQNIDAPWTEAASEFGEVLSGKHRSTSVGDYVRFSTKKGYEYYVCVAMGWTKVGDTLQDVINCYDVREGYGNLLKPAIEHGSKRAA